MVHNKSIIGFLGKFLFIFAFLTTVALPLHNRVAAATNLIANQSVENSSSGTIPNNWYTGGYGVNDATFTYPVSGYNSNKAVQVSMTSYTDGDAKWYFKEVAVSAGKMYEYSEAYKATTTTAVIVQYKTISGSYLYDQIATLPSATNWTTTKAVLLIPQNVTTLTIFHILNSVGTLATDAFSLTSYSSPTTPTFNQGMVTITFDDGWKSAYSNAVPTLKNANLKATSYIITGSLNTPDYVTTADVKAMKKQGLEIGSHTITHPDLTLLSESEATAELITSKATLTSLGVGPIKSIAYPYGEQNSLVVSLTKAAGYTSGRLALNENPGLNTPVTDKFLLRAFSIQNTTTIASIKTLIDQAVTNKSWAILLFHEIDNSGDQYSYTPAQFKQIVTYLKNKGVKVVTISEGTALMSK